MRHRSVPSRRPNGPAPRAARPLFWILACSAPMALAQAPAAGWQGLGDALPDTGSARPAPLALTVGPSLPAPGWRAGHDIGLRWRAQLADDKVIDVTAWRRLPQQRAFDAISQIRQRDPLYGARVEMRLAPAHSRLTTELRAIGLQLDNGARILLRRKDGRPTLYYRAQF